MRGYYVCVTECETKNGKKWQEVTIRSSRSSSRNSRSSRSNVLSDTLTRTRNAEKRKQENRTGFNRIRKQLADLF